MDLQQLFASIDACSVARLQVDLAPVNADGIVCPPTYAPEKKGSPPQLAFRRAHVGGVERQVVVLDSPQSQSNRIELALLQAMRAGRIAYPDITVDFPPEMQEPCYSVLELSHRIYDAVLRASLLGGQPFFGSPIGQSILQARPSHATALFEHAPITLVLGAWDSNGGGGPKAAKIPRLLTSEIIGFDASLEEVSSTKFDPMDIRSNAAELTPTEDPLRRFEIKSGAKGPKGKRPSELGFGSVPSTGRGQAAVISGAVQTSVLSFSGLRHLSFPDASNRTDPIRDQAGRAVLAALGLYGLVAQNESGYLLRARCELIPRTAARLELIGRTLEDVVLTDLSSNSAGQLLAQAREAAAHQGLSFRAQPIHLRADDRLQELVRRSRTAAARGDESEDD